MNETNILDTITASLTAGARKWHKDHKESEKVWSCNTERYTHDSEWVERHKEAWYSHEADILLAGIEMSKKINDPLLNVLMSDFDKEVTYSRAQEIWLYCRTNNIIIPHEVEEVIATRFAREYDDWVKPGKKATLLKGVSRDGFDIMAMVIHQKVREGCSEYKAISDVYDGINLNSDEEIDEDAFKRKARRALENFKKIGFQNSLTDHKIIDYGSK